MIRPIVKDVFFLGQKSEPATKQDMPIGQDLMDTGGLPTPRVPSEIKDGIVTEKDGRVVDAEFRAGTA